MFWHRIQVCDDVSAAAPNEECIWQVWYLHYMQDVTFELWNKSLWRWDCTVWVDEVINSHNSHRHWPNHKISSKVSSLRNEEWISKCWFGTKQNEILGRSKQDGLSLSPIFAQLMVNTNLFLLWLKIGWKFESAGFLANYLLVPRLLLVKIHLFLDCDILYMYQQITNKWTHIWIVQINLLKILEILICKLI